MWHGTTGQRQLLPWGKCSSTGVIKILSWQDMMIMIIKVWHKCQNPFADQFSRAKIIFTVADHFIWIWIIIQAAHCVQAQDNLT